MSQSARDPLAVGIKVLPEDIEKLLHVESPAALSGGITLTANDSLRTSPYLNQKIRNICLILSVMVVFNHAHTLEIDYTFWGGVQAPVIRPEAIRASPVEVLIEHFFSGALGRITNPLFFAASGFLFFYGWKPTLESWVRKLRKRIFTLLIPYVCWSLIGMGIAYGEFLLRNLYQLTREKTRGALSFGDLFGFLFNMGEPSQLWFLRTLMLIMLGAPILGLVISRLRSYSFLLILAVYFSNLSLPLIYKYSVCYFAMGATLGYLRSELVIRPNWIRSLLVPLWIMLAVAYTGLSLFSHLELTQMFRLLILSGLAGIWVAYDLLPVWMHNRMAVLAPYRFFIYMAFDPLLSILQSLYFHCFAPSPVVNLVEYFAMPLVIVLFCSGVAVSLRRRSQRAYDFLTGGR